MRCGAWCYNPYLALVMYYIKYIYICKYFFAPAEWSLRLLPATARPSSSPCSATTMTQPAPAYQRSLHPDQALSQRLLLATAVHNMLLTLTRIWPAYEPEPLFFARTALSCMHACSLSFVSGSYAPRPTPSSPSSPLLVACSLLQQPQLSLQYAT